VKRTYAFLLIAALFLSPAHAGAQGNYYNADEPAAATEGGGKESGEGEKQASNSYVVTSIQKCYAQLGREEALDIQKNYIKPYQECQRRLAEKYKKEHDKKPGDEKATDAKNGDASKDETPEKEPDHGFFRVSKSPSPTADKKPKPEGDAGKAADTAGKN
jgi:hypothetical protein